LVAVAVISVAISGTAWGKPSRHAKHASRHYDVRHGHNRHYFSHGYRVGALPRGHLRIAGRDHRHFYHGGVWYRPLRGAFVVGPAPVGVAVRWLPPYYTTVWVRGFPYYYSNLTYYAWDPARYGYVVVDEPDGITEAVTGPSDLFIYPNQGQSEQKQADDRYECHAWAVRQTGYDPSLPLRAEQSGSSKQLRSAYQRAIGACLEGRGYTVK
jgi:hypothetical protein